MDEEMLELRLWDMAGEVPIEDDMVGSSPELSPRLSASGKADMEEVPDSSLRYEVPAHSSGCASGPVKRVWSSPTAHISRPVLYLRGCLGSGRGAKRIVLG